MLGLRVYEKLQDLVRHAEMNRRASFRGIPDRLLALQEFIGAGSSCTNRLRTSAKAQAGRRWRVFSG